MPAPHVTAFRHTFLPGTTYRFLLEGLNIDSPQSVILTDNSGLVTWTTNSWTFDGHFLAVVATVNLQSSTPVTPSGVPPQPTPPAAGIAGDGTLTIVVVNPPDTPGGPAISDSQPPVIPSFYSSST